MDKLSDYDMTEGLDFSVQKIEKKEKLKHKYIFPDALAKVMSKIDQRTQYEASMMSMTLILIGMIITIVYFILYFDFRIWYKIVLAINGLAGIVFMWSFLVTQFQQYRSYMQIKEFQEEMKGGINKNAKKDQL
jgi:Ca2+/Na+ antiporter